jgi:hypothetical protein
VLEKLAGSAVLHHSYGLTETTFTMFTCTVDNCRLGTPGKVTPGMECKVSSIFIKTDRECLQVSYKFVRVHTHTLTMVPMRSMVDVNPIFQTVTSMSLVNDITVSVILCFRSRMFASNGGTNIVIICETSKKQVVWRQMLQAGR